MNPLDNGTQENCTTFIWKENKLSWPSKIRPSRHVVPGNLTDDPRLKWPTGKSEDRICLSKYPAGTIIPQTRKSASINTLNQGNGRPVALGQPVNLPKGISRHQLIERNLLNKQRAAEAARAAKAGIAIVKPKGSINVRISVPNTADKRQKAAPAETVATNNTTVAPLSKSETAEAVEAGKEVAPSSSASGLLAEQPSATISEHIDEGQSVQTNI